MSPRIDPVPPVGNPPFVQQLLDGAAADTGGAANIFRTLAHHPGLLRRFLPWAGKLLAGGKLPADERELAILRVAVRCGSDYEWGQHVRIAREAGLDDATIAAVRRDPPGAGWSAHRQALLRAVDELVDEHCVADATWSELATTYDDARLLELTMLVGNYVMIAGMLRSVGVVREPGVAGFDEPA